MAHYVKTCLSYQTMKAENRLPPGLLQPILIPERCWEIVTTDLVTDLPPSGGFDAITVFVDKLSKMVHFAPTMKTVDAQEYTRSFFSHVFHHHGLPKAIISDRDPQFTSRFWQMLWELIGTSIQLSIAYHPESDGQSKQMIRTLEDFLRLLIEDRPDS